MASYSKDYSFVERILRQNGVQLKRTKKHRVWKVPVKLALDPKRRTFVMASTPSDVRGFDNMLCDLNKIVDFDSLVLQSKEKGVLGDKQPLPYSWVKPTLPQTPSIEVASPIETVKETQVVENIAIVVPGLPESIKKNPAYEFVFTIHRQATTLLKVVEDNEFRILELEEQLKKDRESLINIVDTLQKALAFNESMSKLPSVATRPVQALSPKERFTPKKVALILEPIFKSSPTKIWTCQTLTEQLRKMGYATMPTSAVSLALSWTLSSYGNNCIERVARGEYTLRKA